MCEGIDMTLEHVEICHWIRSGQQQFGITGEDGCAFNLLGFLQHLVGVIPGPVTNSGMGRWRLSGKDIKLGGSNNNSRSTQSR